MCWLFIFKVTEPSSIPYGTHSACAKRAAYPDPTRNPRPRHRSCRGHIPPQSAVSWSHLWWTKTEPTEFSTWVSFRPEMFSGIGALPKPATESHVVSRGNPVAPCRRKAPRKGITRVGSPRCPEFPNYHELIEEPQYHEAAGNSLTAKGREHT